MSGRPINEDRASALRLGFKTYEGSPHSKCGTTARYTSGGGCVHCARLIATAQREALKFMKATGKDVDSLIPAELVPDDAAERLRHSIDEIM